MLENIAFEITEADIAGAGAGAARRLDKIIGARFPTSTRALIAEAFAAGAALCDGAPRKKSFIPRCGSVVTLARLAEASDFAAAPDDAGGLSIAYEDAFFAAFDKPAGQPCQPVRPGETGTLANAIAARFPEMRAIGGAASARADAAALSMPGMLHRIDAGTSGLVLCAKTQEAYDFARAQFSARTAEKTYLATVEGAVRASGGVSGYLAHNTSFRGKMRPVSGAALPRGERAMFAETFYKPLETRGGKTLLEVRIFTGVTHQIRCQLASIGRPVAGDILYGANTKLNGAFGDYHLLRSWKISFEHPATRKRITIEVEGNSEWGII